MRSRIAADRLRDLQRITDAALAYLPLEALLDELLARVVDILDVDTSAVLLLEDDDTTLVARAAKGLEEEVERGVRIPVGRGFAGRIAATRQPVHILDLDEGRDRQPDPAREGAAVAARRAAARGGRGCSGCSTWARSPSARSTTDDTELLQRAGDRAALAISSRLTERERGLADALQRSLMPRLPALPAVSLAGRYLPAAAARLGGDWYDAFALPGRPARDGHRRRCRPRLPRRRDHGPAPERPARVRARRHAPRRGPRTAEPPAAPARARAHGDARVPRPRPARRQR